MPIPCTRDPLANKGLTFLEQPASYRVLSVAIVTCERYHGNISGAATHCTDCAQQTRGIQPMLGKCWSTVYDAGPAFTDH